MAFRNFLDNTLLLTYALVYRYADKFIAEGFNTIDALLQIDDVSDHATREHFPFCLPFLFLFLSFKSYIFHFFCLFCFCFTGRPGRHVCRRGPQENYSRSGQQNQSAFGNRRQDAKAYGVCVRYSINVLYV